MAFKPIETYIKIYGGAAFFFFVWILMNWFGVSKINLSIALVIFVLIIIIFINITKQ